MPNRSRRRRPDADGAQKGIAGRVRPDDWWRGDHRGPARCRLGTPSWTPLRRLCRAAGRARRQQRPAFGVLLGLDGCGVKVNRFVHRACRPRGWFSTHQSGEGHPSFGRGECVSRYRGYAHDGVDLRPPLTGLRRIERRSAAYAASNEVWQTPEDGDCPTLHRDGADGENVATLAGLPTEQDEFASVQNCGKASRTASSPRCAGPGRRKVVSPRRRARPCTKWASRPESVFRRTEVPRELCPPQRRAARWCHERPAAPRSVKAARPDVAPGRPRAQPRDHGLGRWRPAAGAGRPTAIDDIDLSNQRGRSRSRSRVGTRLAGHGQWNVHGGHRAGPSVRFHRRPDQDHWSTPCGARRVLGLETCVRRGQEGRVLSDSLFFGCGGYL